MDCGTVKFFNKDPGKYFGFITPDKPGPDIYFHGSCILDAEQLEPRKGDRLAFLKTDDPHKPRAWLLGWETVWKEHEEKIKKELAELAQSGEAPEYVKLMSSFYA